MQSRSCRCGRLNQRHRHRQRVARALSRGDNCRDGHELRFEGAEGNLLRTVEAMRRDPRQGRVAGAGAGCKHCGLCGVVVTRGQCSAQYISYKPTKYSHLPAYFSDYLRTSWPVTSIICCLRHACTGMTAVEKKELPIGAQAQLLCANSITRTNELLLNLMTLSGYLDRYSMLLENYTNGIRLWQI